MRHLFLPPEQISGDTALILGNDHQHLARVLRVKLSESLVLLDNAGNAFEAVVEAVEKNQTRARITGRREPLPEPPVFLSVAQALGKGDKLEQVLQHGTEAGASRFMPVRAERSVVDIPANRVADRLIRWQQIAKGAAEQSGRSRIAEVTLPVTFADMLVRAQSPGTLGLLLHPDTESQTLSSCLHQAEQTGQILLAVGPEGGWSPAEVSAARAANLSLISLGPRILRTETAALIAISQILYHMEISRRI